MAKRSHSEVESSEEEDEYEVDLNRVDLVYLALKLFEDRAVPTLLEIELEAQEEFADFLMKSLREMHYPLSDHGS